MSPDVSTSTCLSSALGVHGVDAELDVVETVAQVLVEAGASPSDISRVLFKHMSKVTSAEVAAETATICSKAMAAAGASASDITDVLDTMSDVINLGSEAKARVALFAVASGIKMAQSSEQVSDTMHDLASKIGLTLDEMENEVINAMLESGASVEEVAQVVSRFGFLRAVGISTDEMAERIMVKLDNDEAIEEQDVKHTLDLGGVDHASAMKCIVAQKAMASLDVSALAKLTKFQQWLSQKCGLTNEKIAKLMSGLMDGDNDDYEDILDQLDTEEALDAQSVDKCLDFLTEMANSEDIVDNMDPQLVELAKSMTSGKNSKSSEFKSALLNFLGLSSSSKLNTLLSFQQSLSSLNLNTVDMAKLFTLEKTLVEKGASLDDVAHILSLQVDKKKYRTLIKMARNMNMNEDDEDKNNMLSNEISLMMDLATAIDLANDLSKDSVMVNSDNFTAKVAMAKALNRVDVMNEDELVSDPLGMAKTVVVQKTCVNLELSSDDIVAALSLKTALNQLGLSHLLDVILREQLDEAKVMKMMEIMRNNKDSKVCDADLLASTMLANVMSNLDSAIVSELKSRLINVSNVDELKAILKEINLDVDKLIKVNLVQQVMTDLDLDASTMAESIRVQQKLIRSEKVSRNSVCDSINERLVDHNVLSLDMRSKGYKEKLIAQNQVGIDTFLSEQNNVVDKVNAVLNAVGLNEEQVARVVGLQRVLNDLGASGTTLMELISMQQTLIDDDNDPKEIMAALAKHIDVDTLNRVLGSMDGSQNNNKNILLDFLRPKNGSNKVKNVDVMAKERMEDVAALQLAMLTAQLNEGDVAKVLHQLKENSSEDNKDLLALNLIKNMPNVKESDVTLLRSAQQVAKDDKLSKMKRQLRERGENEQLVIDLLTLTDSDTNKALLDVNELSVLSTKESCLMSVFDFINTPNIGKVCEKEDLLQVSQMAALTSILLENLSSKEASVMLKKIVDNNLSSEEKKRMLTMIEKSKSISKNLKNSALDVLESNNNKKKKINVLNKRDVETLVQTVDNLRTMGQMSNDECVNLLNKVLANKESLEDTLGKSNAVQQRKKENISSLVVAINSLGKKHNLDPALLEKIVDIETMLMDHLDLSCDDVANLLGQVMRKEVSVDALMNKLKSKATSDKVIETLRDGLVELSQSKTQVSNLMLANVAKVVRVGTEELKLSKDKALELINKCGDDKKEIDEVINSICGLELENEKNNKTNCTLMSNVVSALTKCSTLNTDLPENSLDTLLTLTGALQIGGLNDERVSILLHKLVQGHLEDQDLKDVEQAMDTMDTELKTKVQKLIREASSSSKSGSTTSKESLEALVTASRAMVEAGVNVDIGMDVIKKAVNNELKQSDLDKLSSNIVNESVRPDEVERFVRVNEKLEELKSRGMSSKSLNPEKLEDVVALTACLKASKLSREEQLSLMQKLTSGKLSKTDKEKLKGIVQGENTENFINSPDAIMEGIDTNSYSKSGLNKDDLVTLMDTLDTMLEMGVDRKRAFDLVLNTVNNEECDKKAILADVTGKSISKLNNLASVITTADTISPDKKGETVNNALELLDLLEKAQVTDLFMAKVLSMETKDFSKIAEVVKEVLGALDVNVGNLETLVERVVRHLGVDQLEQIRKQREVLIQLGVTDNKMATNKMLTNLILSPNTTTSDLLEIVLDDVSVAKEVREISDALKPNKSVMEALDETTMANVALINSVLKECKKSEEDVAIIAVNLINGAMDEKAIQCLIDELKRSKKIDGQTLKKVTEILKKSKKEVTADFEINTEDMLDLLNKMNVLQSKVGLSHEKVASVLKKAAEDTLDEQELGDLLKNVVADKQSLDKVIKLHRSVLSKINEAVVNNKTNIESCLLIKDALTLIGQSETEVAQLLHRIVTGHLDVNELNDLKENLIQSNLFNPTEIERTMDNVKRLVKSNDQSITLDTMTNMLKLGKELNTNGITSTSKMAAIIHKAVTKGLQTTELSSLTSSMSSMSMSEQMHLLCRIYSALKQSAMTPESIDTLMKKVVNNETTDKDVITVMRAVKKFNENNEQLDLKTLESALNSGCLQRLDADMETLSQLSLLKETLDKSTKLDEKEKLELMEKSVHNKLSKTDMAKVVEAIDLVSKSMSKEEKERLKELKKSVQDGKINVDKVNKDAFESIVGLRDVLMSSGIKDNLADLVADVVDAKQVGNKESNKETLRSALASVLKKHNVSQLSKADMEHIMDIRSKLDTLANTELESHTLQTMHKLASALTSAGLTELEVQKMLTSVMGKTKLDTNTLKKIEKTLRSDKAGLTETEVDEVLKAIKAGDMCMKTKNKTDGNELQNTVDNLVADMDPEELVRALLAQQVLAECLDNEDDKDNSNVMEDLAKLILVQDSLMNDADLSLNEITKTLNGIANSNSETVSVEQRARKALTNIKKKMEDKENLDCILHAENTSKLTQLVSLVDKGSKSAELILNKVGQQHVQLFVDAHSDHSTLNSSTSKSTLLSRLKTLKKGLMDDVAMTSLEVSELLTAAGLNKAEMEEMLGFVVNRGAASKPFIKNVKDVLARKGGHNPYLALNLSVVDRLEWLRDVLEEEVNSVCGHLRTSFLNSVPSEEDVARTCDDIALKFSRRKTSGDERNEFRAALMDILDDAMQDVSVRWLEGDAVFNYFMVAALASTSEEVETRGKEGELCGSEVHELMRQRVLTMIHRLLKEAELSDHLLSLSDSSSMSELRSALNFVLKNEEAKKRLNRRIALLFDLDGVEHTTVLAMTLLDVIRDARHALRPWDLSKMCRHQRKVKGLRRAKVPTLAYSQVFCFYKVLPDHREGPTIGFDYEA